MFRERPIFERVHFFITRLATGCCAFPGGVICENNSMWKEVERTRYTKGGLRRSNKHGATRQCGHFVRSRFCSCSGLQVATAPHGVLVGCRNFVLSRTFSCLFAETAGVCRLSPTCVGVGGLELCLCWPLLLSSLARTYPIHRG